mmetsp:Transcript_28942/g.42529  ORF Transcript_28942/g.42529 Transcript_28942/m.42529 type:complete len:121 (-) Transcript_28942:577-939(-)
MSVASTRGSAAAKALYRSLLRAHQTYLPAEMKQLGDAYVKSEFRLHKNVTKPEQLSAFFREWERYLDQIVLTGKAKDAVDDSGSRAFEFGKELPQEVALSDEQKEQLEKLKDEATKAGQS